LSIVDWRLSLEKGGVNCPLSIDNRQSKIGNIKGNLSNGEKQI